MTSSHPIDVERLLAGRDRADSSERRNRTSCTLAE